MDISEMRADAAWARLGRALGLVANVSLRRTMPSFTNFFGNVERVSLD